MIRYVYFRDNDEIIEGLYRKFKDYYESQMEEPFNDSHMVVEPVQLQSKAELLQEIQRHYQVSKEPAFYRFHGHLSDMIPDWYEREPYYIDLVEQEEQVRRRISEYTYHILVRLGSDNLPVCSECGTVIERFDVDNPLCPHCNSLMFGYDLYLSELYKKLGEIENDQEWFRSQSQAMDLRCLTFIEEDWD